jgi:hypothetical protein
MGRKPLESAIAKIDRAKHHLSQLNAEIDAAREQKKHGISFVHQTQSNELVISAVVPHDLFLHFGIVAGEVIGQARSALEHAVWELIPAPVPGKTGFPIFTAKTKADAIAQGIDRYYDREILRMLPGIKVQASAIIEGLQPFGPDYTKPLYVLNELWNTDKHRVLNFCIANIQGIQLYSVPAELGFNKMINVPAGVKDGTELFRERYPGPDVQVGAEVAMSEIVFDGGLLDQKEVTEILLHLVEFAGTVIDDLVRVV